MFGDVHGDLPDARFMRQGCHDAAGRGTLNADKFQLRAPVQTGAKCADRKLLKT
jgi:hypothetical protein